MGDRYRKAQLENVRRGREKALRQAAEPRLFCRPEVTRTLYGFQPDKQGTCQVGDPLTVMVMTEAGPVLVCRGTDRIGVLEGDCATALRQGLVDPGGPGIGTLRVSDVCDLTGQVTAEMVG
jgi:hypothetical protein